jgi:hypothetical protein
VPLKNLFETAAARKVIAARHAEETVRKRSIQRVAYQNINRVASPRRGTR